MTSATSDPDSTRTDGQASARGLGLRLAAYWPVAAAALGLVAGWLWLTAIWAARVGPNSDNAGPVVQAADMVHGNWALSGWWMAADHFWTSELPLYIVGIVVRGYGPGLMRDVPIAIWLGVMATAIYLATYGRVGSWRRWVAVAAVLGLLGVPGTVELLFGPIHIGTMLFCLTAMVLVVAGLRAGRRQALWLTGAAVVLAAGTAGDPMGWTVGVLPVALAALAMLVLTRQARRWLPVVAVAAVAAVVTRMVNALPPLVGGFTMLPPKVIIQPLGHLLPGTRIAVADLLTVSGRKWSELVPASDYGTFRLSRVSLVAACLVIVLVGLGAWWRASGASRGHRLARVAQGGLPESAELSLWIDLAVGLSALATFAAYVEVTEANLSTSRHLIPVMVACVILLARGASWLPAGWMARPAAAVVALTVVFQFATAATFMPEARAIPYGQDLEAWLLNRGLTSGYAPYWDGLIHRLQTGGRLQTAAITTNGKDLVPFRWNASEAWYRPGSNARFVAINPEFDLLGVDEAAIRKTFGPPTETEHVGKYTVFIYDRDISLELHQH